jgi:hypothetical protein
MSTRGVIAIGTAKGWAGVYQHNDSYPTWLGRKIWEFLKKQGIQAFMETIAQHPGGWSSWPERCYCHHEAYANEDRRPTMYLSADFVDPLFSEWVYVLDPATEQLHIIGSRRMGKKIWQHCLLRTVSLEDNEPDWTAIRR